MSDRIFIVPGRNSFELAKMIAEHSGYPLAKIEWTDFTDGEFKPQYLENLRHSELYIVNSTNAPERNFKEVLLLIDAAVRASADKVITVIPYFGGQRQERKDKGRVPITAKLNVDLLATAGVYKIVSMDLHADAIQAFFPRFDHIYASAIFVPFIKELKLERPYLMALDTGGSKRIEKYAKYFGWDFGICYKGRGQGNDNIERMMLLGDVTGKDVILVDDMIDTAGSVKKLIELMIENEARSIRCLFTHPVCSGEAYERIKSYPEVEFIVTDTIPLRPEFLALPNFKSLSVAPLLSEVIKRDISGESISSLFVF